MVISWKGHYLSENWDVIEGKPEVAGNPPAAPTEHWMDKHLPGGLRWLGIVNSIYVYHFQWTSIRQGNIANEKTTDRGHISVVEQNKLQDLLVARDERPDRIFLKRDVYGITFQNIDDTEMIPLSFIALLTGRVTNPYKALFAQEQWLEQVTNFLRAYIKQFVGEHSFRDLATKSGKDTRTESETILGYPAANGIQIGAYIKDRWGFTIEQINLVNFETGGKRGLSYEESAAKKYQANREAEAVAVLAQAEKGRIITISEGESTRLENIGHGQAQQLREVTTAIKEGGEQAELVRTLEALETAGENGNTIFVGSQNLPQMIIDTTKKSKVVQPEPTYRDKKGN
jgi:hypothetical protein